MSEQLRAALRALDGDIAAGEAKLAQLRQCRDALAVVVGPDAAPALAAPTPSPVSRTGERKTLGRSRSRVTAGRFRSDAIDRILAHLATHPSVRKAEVVTASGVSRPTCTRIVQELVAAKRLVKTGRKSSTRYSLPGRANAPAEPEGDRGARRAARR